MTRKDFYFILCFFVLPFLFLSGTLTSSRTFFMRDLTYLFHPWRTLSAQLMQAGEMPLWNSYQMGGMPFLANCQSAILYPFTILFYIFHFVHALKLFHFFHYALAGLGFYLLGRKIGFSQWSSFAGSIVFSYNGYCLTRLEFLSVIGSIIWLPWILIFLTNIPPNLVPPRRWDGLFLSILLGITVSLSFFAGFPQIVILQILCALLFSLFFLKNNLKKISLTWGIAFGFLLLLSSVQWIPTLELWKNSIRSGSGVDFSEAGMYSLPVDSLLGLIVPFRILHHTDRFTGEKFFWIWSGWWGVVASCLSLLAFKLFRSQKKKLIFFALLIGSAGLIWSLGIHTPIFKICYQFLFIPKLFRYPPVALYWAVFAVSILVLCGLSVLERVPIFKLRTVIFSITIIFLVSELWHYSRNVLPTINEKYFQITFDAIQTVQKDHPGAVMLSPKIDRERKLAGTNSFLAAIKFRAFLFDLTNLPYRIKTFVVSGEPLTLRFYDHFYGNLMKFTDFRDARILLNFWNVTHFLSNDVLEKSWNLIFTDENIKVYGNPQAMGEVFSIEKTDINNLIPQKIVPPVSVKISNKKIETVIELQEELVTVFNVPDVPGWKLFCSNCSEHAQKPLKTFKLHDYFKAVSIPNGGIHHLYLVYQPLSWTIALLCALMTVITLIIIGLYRIKSLSSWFDKLTANGS